MARPSWVLVFDGRTRRPGDLGDRIEAFAEAVELEMVCRPSRRR